MPVRAGPGPVSAGEIVVGHVCHHAVASKYVCMYVCAFDFFEGELRSMVQKQSWDSRL